MRFLPCLLLTLCLSACAIPYRLNYARYSSPLRKEMANFPGHAQVRSAILAVIPIGTPLQIVEERIRKNFSASIQIDDSTTMQRAFPKSDPRWTRMSVPTYESGVFPWGYGLNEVHFLFDSQGRLRDATIVDHSGWVYFQPGSIVNECSFPLT